VSENDIDIKPGDQFRVLPGQHLLYRGRSFNEGDTITVAEDDWAATPPEEATAKPGAPGVRLARDFTDHLGNRWRLVSRGGPTGRTTAELVPRQPTLEKAVRLGWVEPVSSEVTA
jgi:hypothetical protein